LNRPPRDSKNPSGVTSLIKVGIMSIQGDVQEHLDMMDRAINDLGLKGKAIPVKRGPELKGLDGLVMPGGESTTISKLLTRFDMYKAILKSVEEDDLPILGTCAGCILLAKQGDKEVKKTNSRLFGLMDMKVGRNSYGRQVDSFEADIKFKPITKKIDFKKNYHAVFIRAPAILKVNRNCKVLAEFQGEIIAAQEGRRMALTFHPELTDDTRIHRYFLSVARG